MKKLLYLLFLLPTFLFAQPRYGVEGIPMCWTIGSVDSNITRFVIISSTGSPVQTIAWENAAGQVINVSGGYLRYGYCDCAGSSGGGNGIYGGSGTLPSALVQVQNTHGIKFVEPGTQNGILIANKATGAAAVALDPTYTDSIRQGLIWKQGTDSAAVGIDKDGRLQLLSNNWVAIGNDQAKIIIRKDDAIVLIKTGNNVYGLADGVPLSGKNNVMLWPNGSASGRFANLDSLVDGRAKRDTFITVPPSTNYFQNIIDYPSRFYNNIYLSCKGGTDTSIVVFLAAPIFEEQKGVTYHIKNDSGLVAAFVINYEHLSNNKRFYLLKRGQTAQVRLLPDAALGGDYRWAVNVVWDSIFDSQIVNPKWLYVSKSTGDNGAAQKGNAQKPYSDPFAAREAASYGDEIFVLDGLWWYGVGSEFDPYDTPGLLKNGIIWHFSQGTKIYTYYNEDQFSDDTLGLLYTLDTVDCKILGQLDLLLDWDTAPPDAYGGILGLSYGLGSRLEIEIDTMENIGFQNYETSNFITSTFYSKINLLSSPDGDPLITKNGVADIEIRSGTYFEINAKENSTINLAFVNSNPSSTSNFVYISSDTTGKAFVNTNGSVGISGNGEIHINQSGGFIRIQNMEGELFANLENVNLGKTSTGGSTFEFKDNIKAYISCKGCFTTDSIYFYIGGTSYLRNPILLISGDIDLSGGSFFFQNNTGEPDLSDFKGLILKDVTIFESSTNHLFLGNYYPTHSIGVVFLDCWINSSTPPILGINQQGEPISSY